MKRLISFLVTVSLLASVCAGLPVGAGAAGGDITAKAQGTYVQSTNSQEIVIRLETPGVRDTYCVYAIDGGIELPAGWKLKGYTTSNTAQQIVGGDYNTDNGKLNYFTDDVEDTISAKTYYEAVIEVPANAAGDFTVSFKDISVGSDYGATILANVARVSAKISISGTEVPPADPEPQPPVDPEPQPPVDPEPEPPVEPEDPSHDNCPSAKFTDVNQEMWYHEGIDYVIDNGLMNGVGDNLFSPNGTTNRAMIVTILYRLEGTPGGEVASFTDVADGQWYSDAVGWAAANGIVTGYENGTFGPLKAITREQLAAILYRYASYKDCDVSASASLQGFGDAGTVSSYAVPSMQWAVGAELINGMDGNLKPKGTATRAQVATILMRFCENVAN